MNITSRFTLLAGAAGLLMAGCSAPADDDGGSNGPPPPPSSAPPFAAAGGQGGAGQVTPSQGGASSTPAGAGTGGSATAPVGAGGSAIASGGAAGGGGLAGAGNGIPVGMGLTITHGLDGWVAGGTNAMGIQGSFYTFSDATQMPPGATTIQADDFATSPTSVCVSGTASQVLTALMPDYTRYYGGGLGLNLADPGNMMPTLPWSRGNVVGFSFTVSGPAVPADLRFKATFFEGVATNSDYCVPITSGAQSIRFEQIVNQCYTGGLGAPPLAPTAQLAALQWQVATNIMAATPFDFCIDNLTAIMGP